MDLIRRSISFPEDIYETLRLEAFSRRVSVNQLIKEKIRPKKKLSVDEQLKRDFALFDRIGRSGVGKIDLVKALREERDRDNA